MGDVVTALGRAVQEEGHQVEVILPKYDCIQYDEVGFCHTLTAGPYSLPKYDCKHNYEVGFCHTLAAGPYSLYALQNIQASPLVHTMLS